MTDETLPSTKALALALVQIARVRKRENSRNNQLTGRAFATACAG